MPVRLDVEADGRATVLLDRPRKRNALDRPMLESLREVVAELRHHLDARVVVVRGAGGAFCAGADIADWADPGPELADELSRLGSETFAELAALPQPSVAVLEGPAVGGGLELALACDLRVAATDAVIGMPEARLGNLPSWGGLARLVQAAGSAPARQLLLTGAPVDGTRAERLGVVTAVATPDRLTELVDRTVAELLEGDPLAQALAKRALAGYERPLTEEAALAAYTAMLPSSQGRKNDFLARRAAAKSPQTAPDARPRQTIAQN